MLKREDAKLSHDNLSRPRSERKHLENVIKPNFAYTQSKNATLTSSKLMKEYLKPFTATTTNSGKNSA
jgi:hypothetical protein